MQEHHRRHALDVANAIERHAGQYNQALVHHRCGTPGCVAGWSAAVARVGTERAATASLADGYIDDGYTALQEARENFGLTKEEARYMFDGHPYGGLAEDATAAEAVAMLRRFAQTDELRWPAR